MSTDEKRGRGGQDFRFDPYRERRVLQSLDALIRTQMSVGLALSVPARRGPPGGIRGSAISSN